MTDEELKVKAEKATTKSVLLMLKVIEDECTEMTQDEQKKFLFYFMASYGNLLKQIEEAPDEEELDMHEFIDASKAAYEMVYEEDQKPEWDS